ncbi:RHS repeat-associated core domain-containing protein, partial [Clostridium saccharoperbutylacetonicum]|uniref:RHS repeat-associated core domain-containing protein n=1 Tax=Clostridium saccharoperbutylacetonicum TaxID=36745 RepID=UPI0039E82050
TLNQQVKAITKDGNTLISRYDTEGLRAEIEENEKLTKFIFHKGNVLVEVDEENNTISRFTRGYEVIAADIANSDEDLNSGLGFKLSRYYYTVDEQGSTSFITDKDQEIENEYYYDAFGNVLDGKEQVHNRITYTGQQFDGVTGQYYLRARFYNPVIGRFTQEDIYRGDGLNLYAYCKNNPVRYYDPSGYLGENKERPFELPLGKTPLGLPPGKTPEGSRSIMFNGAAEAKQIVGTNFNEIRPTQDVVNREKVDQYIQRLKSGEKLEPAEAVDIPGKGKYLVEGHHRFVASQESGIPIDIKVKTGNGPMGMPDWSYVEWKEYISEEQFWGD